MLDSSMREHLKKHFRAFLHFLGDIEPKLERHTTYMQNMHKVKNTLCYPGTTENLFNACKIAMLFC